ncbi:hypothetical protein K488DRAFT_53208 [Vararia minispora EC-137]|uniref:Uncharacterized protein n=1 Tax=Vararia minispora EC-137 TaxID=1314806 RepID=A0ACB8QGU9_9AGAM|nr:hypothetical protein K488DRAFT_53208 [Vararia minispora EC-137]
MRESWARYAAQRAVYPLTFSTLAWPVAGRPRDASALTRDAVREFILSDAHSAGISPRARVQAALRRWHPDKFVPAMMSAVVESERRRVEEGVRIVAGHLSEILREVR